MNNSYITIIKEKRTVLSRKRVPLNQNECTADFRIGVPFEQNLQNGSHVKMKNLKTDKTVIVPYHSKDLKKGLEQAILKQAGLR